MDLKSLEPSSLQIGDIVLLYYSPEEKKSCRLTHPRNGYVLADLSGSMSHPLLTVVPDGSANNEVTNIDLGMFKVLSANKYKAQERYVKLMKFKEVQERHSADSSTQQYFQYLIEQAKRDMEVEKSENAARQARLSGSPVGYGESIQLQHTLTKRFVGVSSSGSSITEGSKIMVYLKEKDSYGCIFKLHPHIQVETLGSKVNYEDKVKFECLSHESQYLHCSARSFSNANLNIFSRNRYELNASVTASPLKIIKHFQQRKSLDGTNDCLVRSNGIVKIFHRTYQSFLMADGSFEDDHAILPTLSQSKKGGLRGSHHELESAIMRSISPNLSPKTSASTIEVLVEVHDEDPNVLRKTSSLKFGSLSLNHLSLAEVEHLNSFVNIGDQDNEDAQSSDINHGSDKSVYFKKNKAKPSGPPLASPEFFWKVVKDGNLLSGEPLMWKEDCRMMHLATRKYLSVSGEAPNFEITMKGSDEEEMDSTVFQLYPAVHQRSGEVDYQAYMRIRHKNTGAWLHLDNDQPHEPSSDLPKQYSKSSGQAPNKVLYKIGLTSEINSEDAFSLGHVDHNFILGFYQTANITAVLAHQVKKCKSIDRDNHDLLECGMAPTLSSITHAKSLVYSSQRNSETKFRQKVMRCLKTVDLAIHLLNYHTDTTSCDKRVVTACFGIIICFLYGNSRKNKAYMSLMSQQIFKPQVWATDLLEGSVEEALIAIAKDNGALLHEKEFIEGVVLHLVQQLVSLTKHETRAAHLFECLSVLCSFKRTPLMQNQEIILKMLQILQEDKTMFLCPLRVVSKERDSYRHPRSKSVRRKPKRFDVSFRMGITIQEDDVDDEHNKLDESYHELQIDLSKYENGVGECWMNLSTLPQHSQELFLAQLGFLWRLCQKNQDVIEVLKDPARTKSIGVNLTFEMMITALRDPELRRRQPNITAMLVMLVQAIYVNDGSIKPYLERIPLSLIFDEKKLLNKEDDISESENANILEIKRWIKSFFSKSIEYSFTASEEDRNQVVVRVLQLLSELIKLGYYPDFEDIKDCLHAIMALLDGTEDFPDPSTKEGTHNIELKPRSLSRRSRQTKTILNRLFSSDVSSVNVQKLLNMDSIVSIQIEGSGFEKVLREFRQGGRYKLTHQKNYFKVKEWAMVVLIHLFDFHLLQSVHNLVLEYHSSSASTIETMGRSREVRSPSMSSDWIQHRLISAIHNLDFSFFSKLPDLLMDLVQYQNDHLIQKALHVLDLYYSFNSDVMEKARSMQLLISEESISVYTSLKVMQNSLDSYWSLGCKNEYINPAKSALVAMRKLCYVDNNFGEPNSINQKIIINFGIFASVLQCVLEWSNHSLDWKDDDTCGILPECLDLLRGLCCKNTDIQLKLVHHIPDLMKFLKTSYGASTGLLLCEIFHGGPEMCMNLEDEQIQNILHFILLRQWEDKTIVHSILAQSLQEIIMVQEFKLPLRHYQVLLGKMFSFIREDEMYLCSHYLCEESNSLRWTILTCSEEYEQQLSNLLIITDVLALCVIGGGSSNHCLCKTIYSKEELLNIICSEKLSVGLKFPFFKLFNWTYVKGQDSTDVNTLLLDQNGRLLTHVKDIVSHLKKLPELLTDIAESSCKAVARLLRCPLFKYKSGTPDWAMSDDFFMADQLLYLGEAVFPFLQILYKNVRQQKVNNCSRQEFVDLQEVLIEVYMKLPESWKTFFINGEQNSFVRSLSILDKFTGCLDKAKASSQKMEAILTEHSSLSQAESIQQDYHAKYGSEIQLNEDFQKFVLNCKTLYEGDNTIESQVMQTRGVPRKEIYSEFLDDERTKPGIRFLPLGESFQQHIQNFRVSVPSDSCRCHPAERLIKQIEISGRYKSHAKEYDVITSEIQVKMDIKCLQILRAIIYNEFVQIDPEEKERDPEGYKKKCELYVHPVQNVIQDQGNALSKIVSQLSHKDKRIIDEILAFIEAILEGGNHHLQEDFYDLTKEKHNIFPILQGKLKKAASLYHDGQFLVQLLIQRMSEDVELAVGSQSRKIYPDITSSLPRFYNQLKDVPQTKSIVRGPLNAVPQDSHDDVQAFYFSEINRFILVSKIVGLMCTGQYTEMQNLLCEQTESLQSINMIEEMASLLDKVMEKKNFTIEMLQLYSQIMETLTEACVGNVKNCKTILDRNILPVINTFLQIDMSKLILGNQQHTTGVTSHSNSSRSHRLHGENISFTRYGLLLKVAAVELLEVLAEKTNVQKEVILHQINEGLDIKALHGSMVTFNILRADREIAQMELEDNAERALFSAYNVCMYIADSGIRSREEFVPTEEDAHRVWKLCIDRSRSVEVVFPDQESKEEILTKVHFNLFNKSEISNHDRELVRYRIDRSSYGDRIRDFQKWNEALKRKILYSQWLQQKKLGFFAKFRLLRYWCLLILTVILNAVILGALRTPVSSTIAISSASLSQPVELTLLVGGAFHLILSTWSVVEYFVVNGSSFVLPKFLYKLQHCMNRLHHFRIFKFMCKFDFLPEYNSTYLSFNVFGISTIFHLFFLSCSLLAFLFWNLFYCFCLLYIIVDNDILQRALRSVTKNGRALLWVACLLLIIIFIYAVISFALFRDSFDNANNIFCQTLEECFVSVLRFGLIDHFLDVSTTNVGGARLRLIFDVTFFIIVGTIGLNIVFGIIVDAFSQLRDEKYHAESDFNNCCFICDLPSHKFDRHSSMGFIDHVKHDHNMWDYIYYSLYLDTVDVSHKAIGKFVYNKIKSKKGDFYPHHRALSVKTEEDEGEELKRELKELNHHIAENHAMFDFKLRQLEHTLHKQRTIVEQEEK